jgi:hypothetical protein
MKFYKKNFEQLSWDYEQKERKNIEEKIEKLKSRLTGGLSLDDFREEMDEPIKKDIARYERWANEYLEELKSIKEDTEKYKEVSEKEKKNRLKAEELKSNL